MEVLALYLPQFHPIPENDRWWGKGFTEWTNVTRAVPLFRGHVQPHLPADLGFYDLRVGEVREAQADLARRHGVTGFCYWHYWFAGHQLLQRPLDEVVASGRPDFPFCVAWANQSWSGIWHGAPNRILIEQTYPGPDDDLAHFRSLTAAFEDPRYIRICRPAGAVHLSARRSPRSGTVRRPVAEDGPRCRARRAVPGGVARGVELRVPRERRLRRRRPLPVPVRS